VPLPPVLEKLSDTIAGHGVLLCDAWGVIHDGSRLFEGVEEALRNFRRMCGPVVIVTNAPRPAALIPPQLDRLGLARDAYDAVVTSGEAARARIAARLPGAAFHIGATSDDPLFSGLDLGFAPLDAATFLICTGIDRALGDTPEAHRKILDAAVARGLPMICANPDIVVRWGGRLVYCAGAIAALYEELGGEVEYCGKPHTPIYRLALDAAATASGHAKEGARVLAIGDGIETDIAGANMHGFDAIYIFGAGGVHAGDVDAPSVLDTLARHGRSASIMERLRW
jgi:HAD superfamily hydrolase (TIGR01459 family)